MGKFVHFIYKNIYSYSIQHTALMLLSFTLCFISILAVCLILYFMYSTCGSALSNTLWYKIHPLTHTHTHTQMHTCTYMHTHTHTCTHAHTCTHTHAHTSAHPDTYKHTHIHVRACTHTNT